MKPTIQKVAQGEPGKAGRRWVFRWAWQWPELLPWRKYNWREFVFILFGVEYSGAMEGPTLEVNVGLLGLCLDVETFRAEERADALAPLNRIQASLERGEMVSIPLSEIGQHGPFIDAMLETAKEEIDRQRHEDALFLTWVAEVIAEGAGQDASEVATKLRAIAARLPRPDAAA